MLLYKTILLNACDLDLQHVSSSSIWTLTGSHPVDSFQMSMHFKFSIKNHNLISTWINICVTVDTRMITKVTPNSIIGLASGFVVK